MLSSFYSGHVQAATMAPKRDRRGKKEKDLSLLHDDKFKFTDCVKVLFATDTVSSPDFNRVDDPYSFRESTNDAVQRNAVMTPSACAQSVQSIGKVPEKILKHITDSVVSLHPIGSPPRLERPKLAASRTSKSTSKLQTKVVPSKMLDKLKTSQESSPCIDTRPTNILSACLKTAPKAKDAPKAYPMCVGTLDVGNLVGKILQTDSSQHKNKHRAGGSSLTSGTSGRVQATGRKASQGTVNLFTADQTKPTIKSSPTSPPATFHVTEDEPTQQSAKVTPESSSLKPSTSELAEGCNQVVAIKPKKPKVLNGWMRPEHIPKPVLAIQKKWQYVQEFRTDHYPLGPETSDCSDSSDSDCDLSQNHSLSTWEMDSCLKVDTNLDARAALLSLSRCSQRQQHSQLYYAQGTAYHEDRIRESFTRSILEASRSHPLHTGQLLQHIKSSRTCVKSNTMKKCLGLVKQKCCYSNEDGGCSKNALPYTRHCIKHIMYNVDQLMFEHCTAKFADNTQCCTPVFDISHELPLCIEHARKRDNYNKMTSEPKVKKPRKKTKPSALTRPPKRGKKKKKQVASGSGKSPVPSSADESRSSFKYSVESSQLNTSDNCLNTESIEDDMSNQLEPDLGNDLEGQLSPGTDLPLDAADLANQASHLLEEHDFTDVLNKIPEDAFNDLFSEPKNGDFLPTEELVRALSAVGKDCKQMGKISSEDISDSDGAIHHLLQADDMDGALPLYTPGSITMDNLSAITSTLTSSELNSISQALSSMTSEAGPHFTNSGSLQSQGPMGSLHDAHNQMQMNTSMHVGDVTHENFALGNSGNLLAADSSGNFLGSSIELATEVYTQVFPRHSTQQNCRGPRSNHWPFNHAESRHHGTVGHSQNGLVLNLQAYTQQLDAANMGVGKATMLPKDGVNADGFCNLATLDHGHCHSQAMGLVSKFNSLPSGETAFPPKDVPS